MLKFKFLLWMLTKPLQRVVKRNPIAAQYIQGKNLVFQIQTRSGAGRHFTINNGKIRSQPGLTTQPQFIMTFENGDKGFATLSAKDSKNEFLSALHEKNLVLSGDFLQILWFQGLTEFLQPKSI